MCIYDVRLLGEQSVHPDSRQKQEVSLFCVDICASCCKSIHERSTLIRLISVEEKPHVAHQHCQTDTTQKATCGRGVVGKKSLSALDQDELTRHNIWSTSVTQQRIVSFSKWIRIYAQLQIPKSQQILTPPGQKTTTNLFSVFFFFFWWRSCDMLGFSPKKCPRKCFGSFNRANNVNRSVNYSYMLEGKNAQYLILKGLEARWLYLIEEKVNNGKWMAGLDKPRLIFKNNRWDYKPMLPWCIPAIFFGFCCDKKFAVCLLENEHNCSLEHKNSVLWVENSGDVCKCCLVWHIWWLGCLEPHWDALPCTTCPQLVKTYCHVALNTSENKTQATSATHSGQQRQREGWRSER